MLRARLAICGLSRPAAQKSAPQHERPAVNITLIDHGAGNVASVERALTRIGAASERSVEPDRIASARALILPGVGHFAALVRALDRHSLRQPLIDAIARGVCRSRAR